MLSACTSDIKLYYIIFNFEYPKNPIRSKTRQIWMWIWIWILSLEFGFEFITKKYLDLDFTKLGRTRHVAISN